MARIQALPGQLYELVCRRRSSIRQRGWWVRLVWICLRIEISRWICSTTMGRMCRCNPGLLPKYRLPILIVWGKNDFRSATAWGGPFWREDVKHVETHLMDTLGVARRVSRPALTLAGAAPRIAWTKGILRRAMGRP